MVLRRLCLPPGENPEPAQASRCCARQMPHELITSWEYVYQDVDLSVDQSLPS